MTSQSHYRKNGIIPIFTFIWSHLLQTFFIHFSSVLIRGFEFDTDLKQLKVSSIKLIFLIFDFLQSVFVYSSTSLALSFLLKVQTADRQTTQLSHDSQKTQNWETITEILKVAHETLIFYRCFRFSSILFFSCVTFLNFWWKKIVKSQTVFQWSLKH